MTEPAHSRSRHLVDPALLPMLEAFPTVDLSDELLPVMRAGRGPLPPIPPGLAQRVCLERRTVPGLQGAPEVPVHIYRPAAGGSGLGCILHIHGGGFVAGAAATLELPHRMMVDALGCVLVSVDYRLAPETRFPGNIEDCYAALRWLWDGAEAMGIDRRRIGVMGESAGGGLAAALALMVRDRSESSLAFQHLIFPMLDDRTCTASDPHPYTGEFVWTPHNNRYGWSALLGMEPGGPGISPYAAPARADSLAGLPPTYIATVALDLFLEEDVAYARRLWRDGVQCELHVYPGAMHAFQWQADAPVTARANADSVAALRRQLSDRY